MKRISFLALVTCAILAIAQMAISVPQKYATPGFADLTVTTSANHLLFFGTLENGFTDEMIQGLHTGIPIQFSFFIELRETDSEEKEDILAAYETRHIINYNTLKDTYKVEIEESGKRFFTYDKLEDAQNTANELNGLKIIELSQIKPKTSYTARIRAELHKKTLPMGLHEVVPFVSWWDIKTKWYSITFTL